MTCFFIPFTIAVGIIVFGIVYYLAEKKKWKQRADARLIELQRLHNTEIGRFESILQRTKTEIDNAFMKVKNTHQTKEAE
mgnify:CR=1 FL=1